MKKRFFLLFALLIPAGSVQAQRQRINFVNLMNRASAPQIFIDHVILPSEDGTTTMSIIFRFDNDFLPYKKITPDVDFDTPPNAGFYTIARLNAEIFKGSAGPAGEPNQNAANDRPRRRDREQNMEDIASRDFWIDTLYTKTFEETTSKKIYASGSLTTSLQAGVYNYVLQLSLLENTNERTSQRRNVRVPDWKNKTMGEIYLTKTPIEKDGITQLPLTNLENNVLFGKNFYALIELPNYEPAKDYSLEVFRVRPGRRDTTKEESVFTYEIPETEILEQILPKMNEGADPTLLLSPSEHGLTYALVKIPNAGFENAAYSMVVKENDAPRPIARTFVKSYWPDMPASLYNLDIAIDHLKYILDEAQVKQIRQGSDQEKEKKFRDFWEQRDPSPGTVYNELMAEYYRRIDYSFKEFGNAGELNGQDSDMGKVYISYGPPDNKERKFPPNKRVLEIWTYRNKTFIFEKQNETGFANFVLVGTE